ncbi:amidohydrolase [Jeotgalibacillus sp. S-D1]|uniref:amidohydrolase n=1 Tax=Jeotgalibacillus sp. S-D1 TaxID=2552189 RepID=UPI00105A38BF|nr:amidohydrolase [Jeotgalibacillus sp. S-D1]TDL32713.1 amidohydrolase [Jeotgalibacillus sp. S-D1]
MKADIILRNGEVITVDPANQIHEAVAVKDNKILATGTNGEIDDLSDDKTQVIDLKGRSCLPGFVDAHLHLTIYGTNLLGVSCIAPHIHSLQDIFADLKEKAAATKKGEWVRAWGFNEHEIEEDRFPTREELDLVSTDHPIVIIRGCNHTSIANSKALELAGIHNQSDDPPGGLIEKDGFGRLTGKLIETAHMNLFKVAAFNKTELKEAMKLASDEFVKAGITSIHDAGGYGSGPEILSVMEEGINAGEIKVRVYAMIGSLTDSTSFIRTMVDAGIVTGTGDERFKIGPAKLFTDGSSTGPTIATREPYTSDPEDYGIQYFSQPELNTILGEAHDKGYQLTAHAQGDRAIEMVLDCIEHALAKNPRANHRHRIEHAGIASRDLQKRMNELDVVIVPNPAFMYVNGDAYLKHYGKRVEVMYPARDYIDAGIPSAFASDSPVVSCDPLLGIHAAVNRKSRSGQAVGTAQQVEILEAIRAYTYYGAYASFDEKVKGSLEAGKFADLVVLNESILSADKEKIKDIQVDMTMINGEVLYENLFAHSL